MRKLILGAIALFFTAIILGFSQDTSKVLAPLPTVKPVPESKPELTIPRLDPVPPVTPTQEEKPVLTIPQLPQIPEVQPQSEPQPQYQPLTLREIPAIQGVKETDFQWLKVDKFIGGRNLESFETQLALDEALDLNNVQWTKTGMPVKRKGYHRENGATHPVKPEGSKIQGLYRFYRESGATYLLAGSQDSVFRIYEDSVKHVAHWFATSPADAWFDMTTFNDQVIIVKENSIPAFSDGITSTNDPNPLGIIHPFGYWQMRADTFWLVTDTQDVVVCTWVREEGERPPRRRYCRTERMQTETRTLLLRYYDGTWEQDEWVGYYIYFNQPTLANPPHDFGKIIKNNATDLYVVGTGVDGSSMDAFCSNASVIVAYYSLHLVGGAELDSVQIDQTNYEQKLFSDFPTAPYYFRDDESVKYQRPYIVLKVGSGISKLIYCWEADDGGNPDTLFVHFEHPVGEQEGTPDSAYGFVAGDSVEIYAVSFYQPQLVEIWDNRVWLAGDSGVYNRLYYSEMGTMHNFKWNNFINIPFGEKSKITGLATYYNDPFGYKETSKNVLVVFTENHIYQIRKTSEGNFAVIDFIDGIGCVAPKSIKNIEGKYIIFLSKDGLYAVNPNEISLLSTKINKFFQETINRSYMHLSAGGYDPRTNHYYLSCPTGASTKNDTTLILNLDFGCFSGANIGAGLWTEQFGYEDTVNLVFTDNDSGWIFNFGYVEWDLSSGDHPIATYQLPLLGNNEPHLRKRFRLVELEYYVDCASGSPALYLDFYVDKSDSLVFSDTISFDANYEGNCFSKVYLNSDETFGRSLSMKISTSVAIEKFWLSQCIFKIKTDSEF